MNEQLRILKDQIDGFVRQAKQKRDDKDREYLMSSIGETIGKNLYPLMKTMSDNTRLNRNDFVELVNYLKTELGKVEIAMPEIKMPVVHVPEPKVTVNIPPINVPDIHMPDEMNVKGWVSLMGVDLNNPLPVQLRDHKGNPVNLFENLTQIVGGGGGGFKVMKVSDIGNSAWGALLTGDGRLKTEASGTSGLTDTELRASAVPVSQVSGANWSVTASATDLDIRDLTDVSDSIRAYQLSGANWSVSVTNTVTVSATDLDIRDLANATDSIAAYQVSGAAWSVVATATDLDIRDLVNASDSVSSYQVSGANWSVSVTENKAEDAVHASGDTGFMALSVRNSTNTTFAADGDYQPIATDGIGRPIIRPVQTRGLLQTAYASIATGTETTLLAGAAGTYFDLVYLMGTNNSDAAVTVDIRSATAGGIQTSIRIPANGTAGVSLAVPIPQDIAADTWTADLPDITGTTVTLSALFSREV